MAKINSSYENNKIYLFGITRFNAVFLFPFNPVTSIEPSEPYAGKIRLTIFDISGKEVSVIAEENVSPGTYKADYDASELFISPVLMHPR